MNTPKHAVENDEFVKGAYRPIFRASAVQRYLQSQERAALPRIACPRIISYLWIVLGLLLVAGGCASWSVHVAMAPVARTSEGPGPRAAQPEPQDFRRYADHTSLSRSRTGAPRGRSRVPMTAHPVDRAKGQL